MPELCLITTCMGRRAHLKESLGPAAGQPGCSCVLVDYSCPEHCGDWARRHYPNVKVVSGPGQTRFNPSRARNAATAAADAPWLCFFDADVVLQPDFAARIVPALRPGNFYLARPWKRDLDGTVVCPRADFLHLGGYDEVFQSWAGEDEDLYSRLRWRGLQEQHFPRELVRVIEHDDSFRVQYFPIKVPYLSQTINLLYRTAKIDLMRLLGRELSEPERRSLYAEADQMMQRCIQDRKPTRWEVSLGRCQSLLGLEIASALIYTLVPPERKPQGGG